MPTPAPAASWKADMLAGLEEQALDKANSSASYTAAKGVNAPDQILLNVDC